MDIWVALILIAFGLLFLVLEVFVFPGFGVSGVVGLLALGAGVIIAFQINFTVGMYTLGGTLVGTIILIYLSIRFDTLSKIALLKNIDSKVDVNHLSDVKLNEEGVSVSRITPMGKARFGNYYVEVSAWSGFIEENQPIKIIKISNNTIYVSLIK